MSTHSTLNQPKLTIQIEGKNQIRDLYNVENFKPTRSSENTWDLNEDLEFVSIYPSTLQLPIRKVIIEAPIFNSAIEQVYAIQLRTTIEEGVTGQVSFVEEVESTTIKSYSEAYGARILDLEIKCTAPESNTKKVSTKVYCWED